MTEIINIFNGSMLFTVAARLLLATFLGGVIGFDSLDRYRLLHGSGF